MVTAEDVYGQLRQVFDPEIPVNIVDLGLVYDVLIEGTDCTVKMTLTSQACPAARAIPEEVKRRVSSIDGIDQTSVEVVWEPPWTPQMISPEGRTILGIEEDLPG